MKNCMQPVYQWILELNIQINTIFIYSIFQFYSRIPISENEMRLRIWRYSRLVSFSIICHLVRNQFQVVFVHKCFSMQNASHLNIPKTNSMLSPIQSWKIVEQNNHFLYIIYVHFLLVLNFAGIDLYRRRSNKLFFFYFSDLRFWIFFFWGFCGDKLNNAQHFFCCYLCRWCFSISSCDNILSLKYSYFQNKFSIKKFTCNRLDLYWLSVSYYRGG